MLHILTSNTLAKIQAKVMPSMKPKHYGERYLWSKHMHTLFKFRRKSRVNSKNIFRSLSVQSSTPKSTSPLTISKGEVHLYVAQPQNLTDPNLIQRHLELLNDAEKEQLDASQNEAVWCERMLTRSLARCTLARYLTHKDCEGRPGPTPQQLQFVKGPHGKPGLHEVSSGDNGGVSFNLSHSSSLITCAVTTPCTQVGVDVEGGRRRPRAGVLKLARRWMSRDEVSALEGLAEDEDQRMKHFIRLWTLKEACVKASGTGFSGSPFSTFSIHMEPMSQPPSRLVKLMPGLPVNAKPDCIVLSNQGDQLQGSGYKFLLVEINSTHVIAICTCTLADQINASNQDIKKLRIWEFTPEFEFLPVHGKDAAQILGG